MINVVGGKDGGRLSNQHDDQNFKENFIISENDSKISYKKDDVTL